MNLIYAAETKFLTVNIIKALKRNTHVQSLANKLSKESLIIKSLKEIVSPCMTCNIYISKFQLLLWFGILFFFWGGGKEDNSNKTIFIIQKKAIKSKTGVNSRTFCKPFFKEFKILALASLYILEATYFIKKIMSVSGAKLYCS